jgi:hypothetical protein
MSFHCSLVLGGVLGTALLVTQARLLARSPFNRFPMDPSQPRRKPASRPPYSQGPGPHALITATRPHSYNFRRARTTR